MADNSDMSLRRRAERFCERFGLRIPVLLAPMAGSCPPSLSVAVMQAGAMGACGALLMQPNEIAKWAEDVRAEVDGAFQVNLWIPEAAPLRDRGHEARVREFLSRWGPTVPENAGDTTLPDFNEQCRTLLQIAPRAVSSIMGLFPSDFISDLKTRRIAWFATASTVTEAKSAEAAGADVIIAQGMEAGGHRGAFDAGQAERQLVGLFALLPAIVNAVQIPVVAAGGIEENGTLGGQGCAVAAAAMVMKSYGIDTDPQQLNWFLTVVGGYTDRGWLYWDRAAWVSPDRVRHVYEDLPSYHLIDSNLARGNPVIVRVRLGSGVTHFVVIAGKDGFDYLIRDPGAGAAKGFYPLRELHSDIEALRFYQPLTPGGVTIASKK